MEHREYFEGVDILRKIGVNFVGIDFDVSMQVTNGHSAMDTHRYCISQQTFISRHTGGRWEGSPEDLATWTRPEFKLLVPILLESGMDGHLTLSVYVVAE